MVLQDLEELESKSCGDLSNIIDFRAFGNLYSQTTQWL
jgi:hypothetical protein